MGSRRENLFSSSGVANCSDVGLELIWFGTSPLFFFLLFAAGRYECIKEAELGEWRKKDSKRIRKKGSGREPKVLQDPAHFCNQLP